MVAVLFVCTGNICRSPTADGVLRRLVAEDGLEGRINVDSAGTGHWHAGDPPDPRAIAAAARRGTDLSPLRARVVVPDDLDRFDLVLAMDNGHLAALRRLARTAEQRQKIELFLGTHEVPDPYYGDATDFAHVLDLCEAGCQALMPRLKALL